MRVTNQMSTNNALYNLQKQEQRLSILENQYSTQKQISTPSEDPIIAVRALKLRTNYSEVTQFVEKNIPDASNWMDLTVTALDNTSEMLTTIYENCVQGANDDLNSTNRTAIANTLNELRKQIYQEGTTTYAGRYLFTGYKTDTNLIFGKDTNNEKYTITEKLDKNSITSKSEVINQVDPTAATAGKVPTRVEVDRIRLAYDNCESAVTPTIKTFDAAGNQTGTVTISRVKAKESDVDYSNIGANDAIYVAETGEVLLGSNIKSQLEAADSFNVTYDKNTFKSGDLRPEHYFDCKRTDASGNVFNYTASNQEIQYLVNYNQQMTVNVQAKDCYTHDIGRDIDDILGAVDDVVNAEKKVADLKAKMDASVAGTADYTKYKNLYDAAVTEKDLKTKIMQQAFSKGETLFTKHQTTFSNQETDIGARGVRLDLISSRLESQQADVKDLMSKNEDVDLSDVIIRYTSAYDVYTASLSATSKSIHQTLLDFL